MAKPSRAELVGVLTQLGRQIQKGEPISLSSATFEPDPETVVEQAGIRDIARRNQEGEPQIFSGITPDPSILESAAPETKG